MSSCSEAFLRTLCQISMAKSVLLLLKMEVRELMRAAIITAIIRPRSPGKPGMTIGYSVSAFALLLQSLQRRPFIYLFKFSGFYTLFSHQAQLKWAQVNACRCRTLKDWRAVMLIFKDRLISDLLQITHNAKSPGDSKLRIWQPANTAHPLHKAELIRRSNKKCGFCI